MVSNQNRFGRRGFTSTSPSSTSVADYGNSAMSRGTFMKGLGIGAGAVAAAGMGLGSIVSATSTTQLANDDTTISEQERHPYDVYKAGGPIVGEPCSSKVWGIPPVTNVILMIGDGMGPSHVKAAQIYRNVTNPSNQLPISTKLSMQQLPIGMEMMTHSYNSVIAESCSTASAMATGCKVNNFDLSVKPGTNAALPTVLECAAIAGIKTGLVDTSSICHATPGAFAAHVPDSLWTPGTSSKVAAQLLGINNPIAGFQGVDVLLGFGATSVYGPLGLWTPGYTNSAGYYCTLTLNDIIDPTKKYLGLFPGVNNWAGTRYPTLAQMATKAMDMLKGPNGFFLMIENDHIDGASHEVDWKSMKVTDHVIPEVLDLDAAVKAVIDKLNSDVSFGTTLLIVTADHETGGLIIDLNNGVMGDIMRNRFDELTYTYTFTAAARKLTNNGHFHTAANVPVYIGVFGASPGQFEGIDESTIDNTHLANLIFEALGLLQIKCIKSGGTWNPNTNTCQY